MYSDSAQRMSWTGHLLLMLTMLAYKRPCSLKINKGLYVPCRSLRWVAIALADLRQLQLSYDTCEGSIYCISATHFC